MKDGLCDEIPERKQEVVWLTHYLCVLVYSNCYGKSLKSLRLGDTILGCIFLDPSEHCEENRLDTVKNGSREHSMEVFSGSGEQ